MTCIWKEKKKKERKYIYITKEKEYNKDRKEGNSKWGVTSYSW